MNDEVKVLLAKTLQSLSGLLDRYQKHLMGQHDQSSHSHGGGGNVQMAPDTGGGFGGGGASTLDRSERAKTSYKPSTREKQLKAYEEQARIAKILKGVDTEKKGHPIDVMVGPVAKNKKGGFCLEVKTIQDNKNEKLNTRNTGKKREYAKKHKAGAYTLAIDIRGKKRKYYVKEGYGAYRVGGMDQITESELKAMFAVEG